VELLVPATSPRNETSWIRETSRRDLNCGDKNFDAKYEYTLGDWSPRQVLATSWTSPCDQSLSVCLVLALVVYVLQTTQNLVISRRCFAEQLVKWPWDLSASWNTFLSESGSDVKVTAPEPYSFPRINQSQLAPHILEAVAARLIVQSQVVSCSIGDLARRSAVWRPDVLFTFKLFNGHNDSILRKRGWWKTKHFITLKNLRNYEHSYLTFFKHETSTCRVDFFSL